MSKRSLSLLIPAKAILLPLTVPLGSFKYLCKESSILPFKPSACMDIAGEYLNPEAFPNPLFKKPCSDGPTYS